MDVTNGVYRVLVGSTAGAGAPETPPEAGSAHEDGPTGGAALEPPGMVRGD